MKIAAHIAFRKNKQNSETGALQSTHEMELTQTLERIPCHCQTEYFFNKEGPAILSLTRLFWKIKNTRSKF